MNSESLDSSGSKVLAKVKVSKSKSNFIQGQNIMKIDLWIFVLEV